MSGVSKIFAHIRALKTLVMAANNRTTMLYPLVESSLLGENWLGSDVTSTI